MVIRVFKIYQGKWVNWLLFFNHLRYRLIIFLQKMDFTIPRMQAFNRCLLSSLTNYFHLLSYDFHVTQAQYQFLVNILIHIFLHIFPYLQQCLLRYVLPFSLHTIPLILLKLNHLLQFFLEERGKPLKIHNSILRQRYKNFLIWLFYKNLTFHW